MPLNLQTQVHPSTDRGTLSRALRVFGFFAAALLLPAISIRAADIVPRSSSEPKREVPLASGSGNTVDKVKPMDGNSARDAMHLLKGECFSCHNEKKKKGGLVMTSREALLKGSDSGAVVEPGNQESSLLTKVLLADADPHMPPKGQLTDAQIQVVRNWIQSGMGWDAAALAG